MPEPVIPPPTAGIDHYRSEVARRAALLGRRRRAVRAGSAAGALALAALVAVVVSTHVPGPGVHPSASPARPTPSSSPTGSGGRTGDAAPSGAPGSAGSPGSTAPSATAAHAQTGVNAASVPPEFALGRSSDQVTVDERPSGVVVTVDAGQTIDVVLPVRPGGWGRAVIVQHGPHGRHVVSLVGQARSGPTGSVVLRALGQGTATVSVPPAPAAGSGPAPWRGTVVVRAPAGFECPKGASSCHRPAGPSPSGG